MYTNNGWMDKKLILLKKSIDKTVEIWYNKSIKMRGRC
jgi:hypothetical protein